MNVFEAIVIIAIFAIIASIIKNKQNKQPQAHQQHHNNQPEAEQMQAQIMDLKKRIETLEAIVTDKKYNLKREIDDL